MNNEEQKREVKVIENDDFPKRSDEPMWVKPRPLKVDDNIKPIMVVALKNSGFSTVIDVNKSGFIPVNNGGII
jgi:hypothetical protein